MFYFNQLRVVMVILVLNICQLFHRLKLAWKVEKWEMIVAERDKYASDILLVKEVKNGYGGLFLWLVVTGQVARIAKTQLWTQSSLAQTPLPWLYSPPGLEFLMWNSPILLYLWRKHWVEMKEIDCQNDPCRGSITLSFWKWNDFILKLNKIISFTRNLSSGKFW